MEGGEKDPLKGFDWKGSLKKLKSYSDVRPTEEIHSNSPEPGNLWRKGPHGNAAGILRLAQMTGQINDEEELRIIDEFNKRVSSPDFQNKPMVEQADVDELKALLNRFIPDEPPQDNGSKIKR